LVDVGDGVAIKQGAQALLLSPGSCRLVRRIALIRQDGLPDGCDQEVGLNAVESVLTGNRWLEVAEDGSVDFQVAVNEKGEYEIWDPSGEAVPNLRPALRVGDSNSPGQLVARLVHLAKYHAVRQITNHNATSPMSGVLAAELVGKRTDHDPADPFEGEPFEDGGGHTPILRVGEWTGLRIHNRGDRAINVTVLDMRPSWSVRQIYPAGQGDYFITLGPGDERVIALRADLPGNYAEGTDILKTFGTLGTTNFRWLELPDLDGPAPTRRATRSSSGPLELLMSAMTADAPPTRHLSLTDCPSAEWTTAEVEIAVRR
jgi:hypothetical protein